MERTKMEACPFDAATRASRCEDCCAKSGGLTPCVAAWLASRAGYVELVEPGRPGNVVELRRAMGRAA
ncbi:MAG: hypothetical protein WED87_08680 [Dehalococcoidia bacterium]